MNECVDGPAQIMIMLAGTVNRDLVVHYVRRHANIKIESIVTSGHKYAKCY